MHFTNTLKNLVLITALLTFLTFHRPTTATCPTTAKTPVSPPLKKTCMTPPEDQWHDWNLRDLGRSLNSYLKSPIKTSPLPFQTNKIFRSNSKPFTGCACIDIAVGTPLKVPPIGFQMRPENSQVKNVGHCVDVEGQDQLDQWVEQETKLSKFAETILLALYKHYNGRYPPGVDPVQADKFTQGVCGYLEVILCRLCTPEELPVLYHGHAGVDRTGAMSMYLPILLLESFGGTLTNSIVSALAMDYRASTPLNTHVCCKKKYWVPMMFLSGPRKGERLRWLNRSNRSVVRVEFGLGNVPNSDLEVKEGSLKRVQLESKVFAEKVCGVENVVLEKASREFVVEHLANLEVVKKKNPCLKFRENKKQSVPFENCFCEGGCEKEEL